MTKHTYRQVTPEDIETDDLGRVTDPDLRLWYGQPNWRELVPIHVGMDKLTIICKTPLGNRTPAMRVDELYIREEKPVELSELIPDCVPNGWWVWQFDRNSFWYRSLKQPKRHRHGWNEVETSIVILESEAPDLYQWNGPIEQACIQVKREEANFESDIEREVASWPKWKLEAMAGLFGLSMECLPSSLLKREETSARGVNPKSESASLVELVETSDSPADSDGWISNTGSCPLGESEKVIVRDFCGLVSVRNAGSVEWGAKVDMASQEWRYPHWKPAGKEWILHDGSTGRPKTPNRVDVIYRDGQYIEDHDGHTDYFWTEYEMHPETDVLWYRVIKEPEELTKRLKAGELKSHNREPLEVRMRVRSHDSIDFTDVPSLDKNAVLFREVIKPELKELPDCSGHWISRGQLISVFKTMHDGLHFRSFADEPPRLLGALSRGGWLFLDPIIKQAIGDAE